MKRLALTLLVLVVACSPDRQTVTADAGLEAATHAARPTTTETVSAAYTPLRRRATHPAPAPRAVDARTESQRADAACTGPDRRWLCPARKQPAAPRAAQSAGQPVFPPSWTVDAWAIDRQNVTGCASDSNSGTSPTCVGGCSGSTCPSGTGPLLTCQELEVHRWGTSSPRLQQTTTVQGLSSWTADDSDRCYAEARLESSASLVYQGTLATVQTGTLGAVTAKSTAAPGNMLQVVLGAGLSAGETIVNSSGSHPSVALLFSLVSGTTWNVSQPCVPQTVPAPTGCVEVNSWTTGDPYTVSTRSAFAFGALAPTIGESSGAAENAVFVYRANVASTSEFDELLVQNLAIVEGGVGRFLQVGPTAFDNLITNSDTTGWLNTGTANARNVAPVISFDAGQIRSTLLSGSVALASDVAVDGLVVMSGTSLFDGVFLDGLNGTGGGALNLLCGPLAWCGCLTQNCVYGPGVYDGTGMSRTGFAGGTASQAFTCGGVAAGANCLRGNGGITANTLAPAVDAGVINVCGPFQLTPANLDLTQTTTCGNTGLKSTVGGTAAFSTIMDGAMFVSNVN